MVGKSTVRENTFWKKTLWENTIEKNALWKNRSLKALGHSFQKIYLCYGPETLADE